MNYFRNAARFLYDSEAPITEKLYVFLILATIIFVYGFYVTKYTYNQEHIICNETKCEIQHINLEKKKVVQIDKLKIEQIESFEAKFVEPYYYLYANYKDGKSKMVSPCYIVVRYKNYIEEPVKYLNEAIKENPINIDLIFPNDTYFRD